MTEQEAHQCIHEAFERVNPEWNNANSVSKVGVHLFPREGRFDFVLLNAGTQHDIVVATVKIALGSCAGDERSLN